MVMPTPPPPSPPYPPPPPPSIAPMLVWIGVGLLAVASLIVFGATAGQMGGSTAGATFFSLLGHFVAAIGLFRMAFTESMHPALRAGAVIAAALLLGGALK